MDCEDQPVSVAPENPGQGERRDQQQREKAGQMKHEMQRPADPGPGDEREEKQRAIADWTKVSG